MASSPGSITDWLYDQAFPPCIQFSFLQWGFSGGLGGKESTCNAGDPGLIISKNFPSPEDLPSRNFPSPGGRPNLGKENSC